MNFTDIGERYGITKSSVHEIEVTAIRRIRRSEEGKTFMNKYRWKVLTSIEGRKGVLNQFASPEVIAEKMDAIDDLLISVLKKSC
ncbi:hypothetical protein D3C74_466490 [compost metagenome]